MSNNDKLTEAELNQFTGSEHWYRHGLLRSILFTDGAKYLADKAGAYWLLDEIALARRGEKAVAAEEFQVWKLTVDLDRHSATLTCDDGNGRIVFEKPIEYTDFSAGRDQPLVHQQHDLPAERALTCPRPASSRSTANATCGATCCGCGKSSRWRRGEPNSRPDPPPLKWSTLIYGFWAIKEDRNAEEELQAGRDRRQAATG